MKRLDPERQALALSSLRLAYHVAERVRRRTGQIVPLEELQAEAVYALTVAAAAFDEAHGIPFGNYAAVVIRRHMA